MNIAEERMQFIIEHIGRRINFYRKSRNLTQRELGELAGLPMERIMEVEVVRNREDLSLVMLAKIAKALDIDLYKLVKLDEKAFDRYIKRKYGNSYKVQDLYNKPVIWSISCLLSQNIMYHDQINTSIDEVVSTFLQFFSKEECKACLTILSKSDGIYDILATVSNS